MRKFFGSIWWVLFFGATYLVSQAVIIHLLQPIGAKDFLSLQLCFSKKFYLHMIQAWQASGQIVAYKAHFLIDWFHPIWYTLFLTSALATVFNAKSVPAEWNKLLFLPLIAGIADELENLMQIFLLSGIKVTQGFVNISSGCSLVKWTLALGSLLIVISLLFSKKHEARHLSA
ncbi:MAG: hypothetical protein HZC17_00985 [Candidatus Omnitrophica bacterium]|nr:hypothetical protein [Candidatus Omnitrophota bacterium]